MTDTPPNSCSLSTGDLEHRLADIAAIGRESLVGRTTEGRRHLLRFRSDADTRNRLEEVVAAEAACCSFLDFALQERGGELILSLAAPGDGQAVADALAAAFSEARP